MKMLNKDKKEYITKWPLNILSECQFPMKAKETVSQYFLIKQFSSTDDPNASVLRPASNLPRYLALNTSVNNM
jgi:hypothetical protein